MKTMSIGSCIKTSYLTEESYSNLICLLVSSGYTNMIGNLMSVDLVRMWNYLGVTQHGDICTYDHPYSFLEVNAWLKYPVDFKDEDYYNILTEEQLDKLLGDIK